MPSRNYLKVYHRFLVFSKKLHCSKRGSIYRWVNVPEMSAIKIKWLISQWFYIRTQWKFLWQSFLIWSNFWYTNEIDTRTKKLWIYALSEDLMCLTEYTLNQIWCSLNKKSEHARSILAHNCSYNSLCTLLNVVHSLTMMKNLYTDFQ